VNSGNTCGMCPSKNVEVQQPFECAFLPVG
jgi:hypothetical protein